MKRSAIKRGATPRAVAFNDELAEMRPLVIARAHGLCECCGEMVGTVVHHKRRRSQGGTNDLANLMLLSDEHHRRIHEYPAQSYEMGWLLKGWNHA